jgi:hypothetical protein
MTMTAAARYGRAGMAAPVWPRGVGAGTARMAAPGMAGGMAAPGGVACAAEVAARGSR